MLKKIPKKLFLKILPSSLVLLSFTTTANAFNGTSRTYHQNNSYFKIQKENPQERPQENMKKEKPHHDRLFCYTSF